MNKDYENEHEESEEYKFKRKLIRNKLGIDL